MLTLRDREKTFCSLREQPLHVLLESSIPSISSVADLSFLLMSLGYDVLSPIETGRAVDTPPEERGISAVIAGSTTSVLGGDMQERGQARSY